MTKIVNDKMLTISFADSTLVNEIEGEKERLSEAQSWLSAAEDDFMGWVNLPLTYDADEVEAIKEAAAEIRSKCDAFVVIGIGGSYLGARAAIEMLGNSGNVPEIFYAGQNISAAYHKELVDQLKDREICACVISKSGTTTEPAIAFALIKDLIVEKYGKEEAGKRIYAITDKNVGVIREEARAEGYGSFVVPDNVGGRYSVLTAVGLLPIAVAGIDIDEMLQGAKKIMGPAAYEEDGAAQYAALRNLLFGSGKTVEIYEIYEPGLYYFTEWLKQLFGESEGKQGKGIFPAALQFSTDLHSMGQFLQEGNQIFFETVLNVLEPPCDLKVPEGAGKTLSGLSMNKVNAAALEGVMEAHRKAGIPIIKIDIPALRPYYLGQMIYFFEKACALSGYLMGVNPFDQPGVEAYKSEMIRFLKG